MPFITNFFLASFDLSAVHTHNTRTPAIAHIKLHSHHHQHAVPNKQNKVQVKEESTRNQSRGGQNRQSATRATTSHENQPGDTESKRDVRAREQVDFHSVWSSYKTQCDIKIKEQGFSSPLRVCCQTNNKNHTCCSGLKKKR